MRLPGSPIVAKPGAELGKDHAPPKMYEAPKPDPKVEAKPRVNRSPEQPQQRTVNRMPLDQPQPQPQPQPKVERAAPQPQPQPKVERQRPATAGQRRPATARKAEAGRSSSDASRRQRIEAVPHVVEERMQAQVE